MCSESKMCEIKLSTEIQSYVVNLEWKLTNFKRHILTDTYTQSSQPENTVKNGAIESELFECKEHPGVKWRIIFYPFGDSSSRQHYISLYLEIVAIPESLKTFFNSNDLIVKFSIEGKHRKEYRGRLIETTKIGDSNFFYNQLGYVSPSSQNAMSTILSEKNEDIRIDCQIIISRFVPHSTIPTTSNYNILKKLSNRYESLFSNQELCDIRVIVGNDEIGAHKLVMAAHSSVFLAMFKSDMQEKNDNKVEFVDASMEVIQSLLLYMYIGDVDNMSTFCNDLLRLADKYEIKELKEKCEEYLIDQLSVNNVLNAISLASTYNAFRLKTEAINFFHYNKHGICDTSLTNFLEKSSKKTLIELIKA